MIRIRKTFWLIVCLVFAGAWTTTASLSSPDPPENIRLEADINSVTVTWDRVPAAERYYIYWAFSGNRFTEDNRVGIDDQDQTEYTVEGLEPDTEYDFAMSSGSDHLQEGDLSDPPETIRTLPEERAPEPPENFWRAPQEDWRTETSVRLVWDESPDSDVDEYRIYYGTSSGAYGDPIRVYGDETAVEITDLDSDARHYFNITAMAFVNDEEEESAKAGEIIVDTLPDNTPPDAPSGIRAILSDEKEITVTVTPGNENMTDYAGVIIRYGETPGALDDEADTGRSAVLILEDRPLYSTWYFSAVAYDETGNESDPTSEIAITVEEMASFTDRFDDFSSGCFVGSISGSREIRREDYDVTEHRNKAGISGGYLIPAESDFDDHYGTDNYPVFLFYERGLHRYFTADFNAGFMRSSGTLRTAATGSPTGVDATYTMVPVTASLNARFPILPYIWGFVGAGPDYWYIRETSDLDTRDDTSKWIGGYHGRAGLWLYNTDIRYRRWGMMLETRYSVIDRFGKNDVDLGGWMFLIGGFYSF